MLVRAVSVLSIMLDSASFVCAVHFLVFPSDLNGSVMPFLSVIAACPAFFHPSSPCIKGVLFLCNALLLIVS